MNDDIIQRNLVGRIVLSFIGATTAALLSYISMKYLFSDLLDPTQKERDRSMKRAHMLLKSIGAPCVNLSEYELCMAENLIDTKSIDVTWENVAGLDDIIQEIKEQVITPFSLEQQFQLKCTSKLLQSPKGVLLYGPPGCGKTLLSKALARNINARFLYVQLSSVLDKWCGESEKRVEAIFSLAQKIQPTVLFIDEVDSLFTTRSNVDQELTRAVKTQFMSQWDGLRTSDSCKVIIIGATNRPQDIDAALNRRMPCRYFIPLPNESQRLSILKLLLKEENKSDTLDLDCIANGSSGLAGSDLKEICRDAIVSLAQKSITQHGQLPSMDSKELELDPISTDCLLVSLKKYKGRLDTLRNDFGQSSKFTLY